MSSAIFHLNIPYLVSRQSLIRLIISILCTVMMLMLLLYSTVVWRSSAIAAPLGDSHYLIDVPHSLSRSLIITSRQSAHIFSILTLDQHRGIAKVCLKIKNQCAPSEGQNHDVILEQITRPIDILQQWAAATHD